MGLAGVALRLDAFLRNFPLSLDEAAVARNIIDRPWTRLAGWLDYSQLAPPGFLFAEKAIVSVAGSSEYALRAFPAVCALLSVWLCWAVCRRLLPTLPALMAFGLFSLNGSLIEMGTRVKPYSGDIAATLLVVFLATEVFRPRVTRARAIGMALAGGLTCLFSFASVFALAGAAIACLNRARRQPAERDRLVPAAVVWTISAGCGALIATLSLSPADAAYMRWFWEPGFMPFPPRNMRDLVWVGHQLKTVFRWTLFYRASVIWIAAAALGIWSLQRRRQVDAWVLLATPFILVVGASAVKRYPFYTGRVDLFLVPLLLILVAEGADWCRRTFASGWLWIGAAPMIVLLALGAHGTWSGWRIQRNGDLRSPLEYVRQHWQPGDRLFVHYTAAQVFLYYAPRLGFSSTDYVIGNCSDEVQRAALWQVETLRERPRLWVLVWGADETDLLFRYLTATATVRDTFGGQNSGGSSMMAGTAILYHLNPPAGPAMTPATFSTAKDADGDFIPQSCYGVFNPFPAAGMRSDP